MAGGAPTFRIRGKNELSKLVNHVSGFTVAVAVLVALNFGALAVPNSSMAQDPCETEDCEAPKEKRVCAYKGDPNPTCELCGGGLCWDCSQDCN